MSILAIISKAVFEKLAGGAGVGDVLPIDRYTSLHKSLAPLATGGALYLVTVRPPDEQLWLVAILEDLALKADGWVAKRPNVQPIRSLASVKSKLRFASGTGLVAKPGALGMSLQTPRALTDADELLLRAGSGTAAPKAKSAPPKVTATASPKPATKAKAVAPKAIAAVVTTKPKPAPAVAATQGAGAGFAAVAAAVAANDGAAALAAALAWWRADRSPAIADLIDQISERVSALPVEGDAAFSKLALGKQALAIGALLPAITALPVSFLPMAAELLAAFPDDPRIARAAATWVTDPPTSSSSTYPFWTKLFDLLARTGDVRAIPPLRARVKRAPDAGSVFWPKFYKAIDKTIGKLEDVTAGTTKVGKLALGKLAPPRAASITAPSAEAGPWLAQATAHLAAGRLVPAIDAMVRCWREARVPELAELVDRVSRLSPTYDHPIAETEKASLEPWLALFASDPIGELPRLARDIKLGGPKLAERRLAALSEIDDPRLAIRLAELTAFSASPERTLYWKLIFDSLARLRDVRVRAALTETFRGFTGTYYDHHRQAARIVGPFCAATDVPQLTAADAKLMPKLTAAIGKLEAATSTERALIGAIVEDWPSDGPRQVYADWLMERGHPRGELIQLLVSGGDAAALAKTPYIWGALEDLGSLALERGIPHACMIDSRRSLLSWRSAARAPLVAALETIDLEDAELPPTEIAAMRAAATRWQRLLRRGKRVEMPA